MDLAVRQRFLPSLRDPLHRRRELDHQWLSYVIPWVAENIPDTGLPPIFIGYDDERLNRFLGNGPIIYHWAGWNQDLSALLLILQARLTFRNTQNGREYINNENFMSSINEFFGRRKSIRERIFANPQLRLELFNPPSFTTHYLISSFNTISQLNDLRNIWNKIKHLLNHPDLDEAGILDLVRAASHHVEIEAAMSDPQLGMIDDLINHEMYDVD